MLYIEPYKEIWGLLHRYMYVLFGGGGSCGILRAKSPSAPIITYSVIILNMLRGTLLIRIGAGPHIAR